MCGATSSASPPHSSTPPPPPHTPRFFEDYKKNEHKEVAVEEFLGAEAAKKVIRESLVRTQPSLGGWGG